MIKYNSETLTRPGGSLRNSDEVAPDLAWSEMNVCETNLLITTICHSVKWKRENRQTHTTTTDRSKMPIWWKNLLGRDDNCDWNSEQRATGRCCCVIPTDLKTKAHIQSGQIYMSSPKNNVYRFLLLSFLSLPPCSAPPLAVPQDRCGRLHDDTGS